MLGLHGGHVDVYVVLQRLHVLGYGHVGAVDEEVHVYKVESTACADSGKVIEVGQAGLTSAVGDGRCAELDSAVVRLHKIPVDGHTLGRGKVRPCWIVRFIGTVYLV